MGTLKGFPNPSAPHLPLLPARFARPRAMVRRRRGRARSARGRWGGLSVPKSPWGQSRRAPHANCPGARPGLLKPGERLSMVFLAWSLGVLRRGETYIYHRAALRPKPKGVRREKIGKPDRSGGAALASLIPAPSELRHRRTPHLACGFPEIPFSPSKPPPRRPHSPPPTPPQPLTDPHPRLPTIGR